jgi:hypothetical protein
MRVRHPALFLSAKVWFKIKGALPLGSEIIIGGPADDLLLSAARTTVEEG